MFNGPSYKALTRSRRNKREQLFKEKAEQVAMAASRAAATRAPFKTACAFCDREFESIRKRRFCSTKCNSAYYRRAVQCVSASMGPNIAPGTVGAISELRVAADLMTKGMEVFRNLSAHGATDLVIIANRTCFRISVKSAQRKVSGELVVPKEKYPYEILALVLLNDIVYLDPYANVIDVVEYVLRSGLR